MLGILSLVIPLVPTSRVGTRGRCEPEYSPPQWGHNGATPFPGGVVLLWFRKLLLLVLIKN